MFEEMTHEQEKLQARRLFLEEQMFLARKEQWEIAAVCTEHVVIAGHILFSPRTGEVINTHDKHKSDDDCYSVSCAVCGKDFGWYCPVNPKGYCEYTENSHGNCIHCHIPEERK